MYSKMYLFVHIKKKLTSSFDPFFHIYSMIYPIMQAYMNIYKMKSILIKFIVSFENEKL